MTGEGMDAARDLVLSYLPNGYPLWLGGEEHGAHRLDVFHLPPPADDTLSVLALAIDGTFVPDVVSTYPHVPYDTVLANARPPRGEALGVFAWVERVHAADATQARFAWGGRERIAPVTAGHALLIDWDTPWPRYSTRPRPQALCIAGRWQPTVSSLAAATVAGFREGYRAYYDDGARGDDWAAQAFYQFGSFSEKVAMVEAVLDGPGLSDFAHGCLAAGPVEDLIGSDLLDYIEASAAVRARWVPLLHGTYWSFEPPEIRQRLRALLGMAEDRPRPR